MARWRRAVLLVLSLLLSNCQKGDEANLALTAAVQAGTRQALEGFLEKYPDGELAIKARYHLAAREARSEPTIRALAEALALSWLDTASLPSVDSDAAMSTPPLRDGIRGLNAARRCRGVSRATLVVEERYADAADVAVLSRTIKSWLETLGVEVVGSAESHDVAIAVSATGRAVGGEYRRVGWAWSGAWLQGTWSIRQGKGSGFRGSFRGGLERPFREVLAIDGEKPRSAADSPPSRRLFERALLDAKFVDGFTSALRELCGARADLLAATMKISHFGVATTPLDEALASAPDPATLDVLATEILSNRFRRYVVPANTSIIDSSEGLRSEYASEYAVTLLGDQDDPFSETVLIAALVDNDYHTPIIQALARLATRKPSRRSVRALLLLAPQARYYESAGRFTTVLDGFPRRRASDDEQEAARNGLLAIGRTALEKMVTLGSVEAAAALRQFPPQ